MKRTLFWLCLGFALVATTYAHCPICQRLSEAEVQAMKEKGATWIVAPQTCVGHSTNKAPATIKRPASPKQGHR